MLQFLQPLAADAALAGNPDAIEAIETAIDSWYEANSPFRGICWNSCIELGLCAINLLVVASLCGSRLSDATIEKIRTILHAHLIWMAHYPSRFSSVNTHLVAEVAREFLISLAMPGLPLSGELQAKGRKIVTEEADKQFLAGRVGPSSPRPMAPSPPNSCFSAVSPHAPRASRSRKGSRNGARSFPPSPYGFPMPRAERPASVMTMRVAHHLSRHEPAYAASVAAAIAGNLGTPAAGPRR
ncbi:hypothetical protein [Shinella zoogloeoides]|uniref:hypothetical protein n=1 Tax=Shinella zoogloeoides TaxID=352475 RepID=UPI0028A726CF|nr:hypothetical protein [Shinella zoogloeoides]